MARILVVDDEDRVRTILNIMLSSKGHEIKEAADGAQALSLLDKTAFDLVISDIRMDGMDGKELLTHIKQKDIGCPVIFLTAFGTLESAVDALRLGVSDYLVKPFEEKDLHIAVARALGIRKIMAENQHLRSMIAQNNKGKKRGIFVSVKIKKIREIALRVAQSDATVLLSGESGTGKEVIARLIHHSSERASARFVAMNCAAISDTLLESELFGHEKGSFTGANQRTAGKFEYAHGGTLFLDEIGELPLEAQSKFLRAIQEKAFQRVGGNQDIHVDTRLICATNQDLETMVAQKTFRQDLFYRLSVFPLKIPPLRERRDDIIPMAKHFIMQKAKIRELNGEVLTPGACRILTEYPWPGNIRELINVVERVMILKDEKLPVHSDDLGFLRNNHHHNGRENSLVELPPQGINFDALQKNIIDQALNMSAQNQSAAARLLGLSRGRFRTLLKMAE
mgnify:CR=1 FL=1